VSITQTFDNLGRVLTRTYPDTGQEVFAYGSRGMTNYHNQLGTSFFTHYGYDEAGRLTIVINANNETNQFGYDAAGNMTSLTDGKGATTGWTYDIYGRLTLKQDANFHTLWTYQYFPTGSISNRLDFYGDSSKYLYDAVGNLTNIVYALASGNPGSLFAPQWQYYAFDPDNRMSSMFNSNWGTTTLTYTPTGRLSSEHDGDSTEYNTVTNVYLTPSARQMVGVQTGWTNSFWMVTNTYDAAYRLSTVSNSGGGFTYSYGGGLPIGAQAFASRSLPSGAIVTNAYDNVARMVSTKLQNGSTVLNSHAYGYNLANQRTNQIRTASDSVNYTYDNIGQLTAAIGKESGGSTSRLNEQFSYAYDPSHNLTNRTENALVESFVPNNLNFLTSLASSGTATVSGSAVSGSVDHVRVGTNIVALYGDGTYAVPNQVIQTNYSVLALEGSSYYSRTNVTLYSVAGTPQYDGNGNLTHDGGRTYEYDMEMRLAFVAYGTGSSQYIYDGLSRRRQRDDYDTNDTLIAQTSYAYDGMNVIQESDRTATYQAYYTRGTDISGTVNGAGGIGGLLSRTDTQHLGVTNTTYYHSDAGGNVTYIVDGSNAMKAKYLYDPFGNMLGKWGSLADTNLYCFSSKERQPYTSLYYYGYRFYEPHLQRWPNRDPIQEAGGVNLYEFVGNSPINRIDAFGKYGYGLSGQADFKEKCADEWDCGLANSLKAAELASKALSEAARRYPDSVHNGAGDAWRHCYWSCMMTRAIGKQCSKDIGDNHENAGDRHGQPPDERRMDQGNNGIGRNLASQAGDCGNLCEKALNQGSLIGLDGGPTIFGP